MTAGRPAVASSHNTQGAGGQASGRSRWWALVALTVLAFMAGWDATVLNVALPTLAGALHASETQLQWFVASYMLMLAAALLPGGLLGDRYGRRLVLIASLTLFAAGSIICAYSQSPTPFIVARFVMGIGAGAMTPVILSVIAVLFAEDERSRATGIWYAASFASLPLGPIIGGWILTHAWWGWVFLINAPLTLFALLAVIAWVPETRSEMRPAFDLLGILISSTGLSVLIYGFITAGQHGWSDLGAELAISSGTLLLAGFVLWELWLTARPGGRPLVDLGLFRSPSFSAGTVLAGLSLFALYGAIFVAPQYFQAILGNDAMGSGIRLLPLVLGLVAGALPADRVAALIGPKLTVAIGMAVLAIGLGLGATTQASSNEDFVLVWTAITGVGSGAVGATAASSVLSVLSAERAGVGAALMQMVQKTAAPLSAAILGSVLNATYQARVNTGGLPGQIATVVKQSVFAGIAIAAHLRSADLLQSVRVAFITGMDSVAFVAATIAVVGVLLALLFLPTHRQRAGDTATHRAERGLVHVE